MKTCQPKINLDAELKNIFTEKNNKSINKEIDKNSNFKTYNESSLIKLSSFQVTLNFKII